MSAVKYRPGAGTHEKWAIDKMYEYAAAAKTGSPPLTPGQLQAQLEAHLVGIVREKDINVYEAFDDHAVAKLAKDPDTAQKLINRMFDYEIAIEAVSACARTGEEYWRSSVFQHTVGQIEDGSRVNSKAIQMQKAIAAKRKELKLDGPEDRVVVGFASGGRY